jgi:hypothetical protein
MLGWELFVTRQSDPADAKALASWSAGLNGTDWLDELVANGKAADLGGNGYPNRYVVTADVLVAILRAGLPTRDGPLVIGDNYSLPSGWTSEPEIDHERLQSIDPSEILMVEAWDQS